MTGRALETTRLLLEPWHESRRDAWRTIAADPLVMRYVGPGTPWPREQADAVFDRALAHWREHGFGWRSAVDRSTGAWLGFVGLNVVGPGNTGVAADEIEIGWWIVRDAWGRGYASEGAAALRDEGFGRVGLERVIARIQPPNLASQRVAEKIGMHRDREGVGRHGEPFLVYALDRAG